MSIVIMVSVPRHEIITRPIISRLMLLSSLLDAHDQLLQTE